MKLNRETFKQILDDYYSRPYNKLQYVLAVDFDQCLCYSHFPECGEETPICNFIRSIQDMDYVQILTTCREDNSLELALKWCKEHNIRIYFANENDPERIKIYEDCRKVFCNMLIDDTSYNFNMEDFT